MLQNPPSGEATTAALVEAESTEAGEEKKAGDDTPATAAADETDSCLLVARGPVAATEEPKGR